MTTSMGLPRGKRCALMELGHQGEQTPSRKASLNAITLSCPVPLAQMPNSGPSDLLSREAP